jgi:hypothetical protein
MVAMTSQKVSMETLVRKLQQDYPDVVFRIGDAPCWSPRNRQVIYTIERTHSIAGLFHELAHAHLKHEGYASDLDLLAKEVSAWETARTLAHTYDIIIDAEHVEDCLDTYRDWLHKRSTCPRCHMNGLQHDSGRYNCINCDHSWRVSTSRFCRPYRRSAAQE